MFKKLIETDFLVYIVKCLIGLTITYCISQAYPQHQFFWSIISVLLAFSPDGIIAKQIAFDRMKANILGSMVGMVLFLVHVPNLFFMGVGVVFIIIIATILNIQSTTRSALAAVIIVMFHEKDDPSWTVALERMICVIIGCLIALLLTLLFDFLIYKDKRKRYFRRIKVIKGRYIDRP